MGAGGGPSTGDDGAERHAAPMVIQGWPSAWLAVKRFDGSRSIRRDSRSCTCGDAWQRYGNSRSSCVQALGG